MQRRRAGIRRRAPLLRPYRLRTTGRLLGKDRTDAHHAGCNREQPRIYHGDKMSNDNDNSPPLSLGDIISTATFAIAIVTALLYVSGWTYAYYYFDRFRIPLLMLDLPKESYFVYGGLVLWKNPIGTAIITLCILVLGWACRRWSGRLGRFAAGTLVLLGMAGLFALGRAGGIAAAQSDFLAQRDSDYSAYPRLSLALKKDSDEATKTALAVITKDDCGRLILFNNDRLFAIRPIRGASAVQLETFVVPADQIAALRIRADYTSCS